LSKEATWESLIEFLQKESNVLQQKVLLLGKTQPKEENGSDGKSKPKEPKTTNHLANPVKDKFNETSICSFCGEDGHVQTTGPGGKKVVQYFSCEKFASSSPGDRFKEIRKKNFCFQCLLPGAGMKHKDGKCQTDFVCKHPSHERFPLKKHVLVCDDHKDMLENQALLEEYKARCILKANMPELPAYSKEIKLTFHSVYSKVLPRRRMSPKNLMGTWSSQYVIGPHMLCRQSRSMVICSQSSSTVDAWTSAVLMMRCRDCHVMKGKFAWRFLVLFPLVVLEA
jgi:hypothetical protein